MVIAQLFFFDGINRIDIMFIHGPDLITGIMATDSQHITVIRYYSQRKSLTSRQEGPVILSDIFLL